MKKVLVTGSLGYLGSVLLPYLTENGLDCVGYDTGFFRDCCLYPCQEQRAVFKDMRDFTGEDLKGIDAVVHLAAMSNDPLMSFPAAQFYGPVRKYSLDVAKLCKERCIKFIFASSCSVYGIGSRILNEDSGTDPQTGYSLNKLQVENDLAAISGGGFAPVVLRFATAYGLSPRMRFDLVINMLAGMAVATKKIILNSDGKSWRPFVHVQDICKAIRYAVGYDYTSDKPLVLNVGDNRDNYQIIDIAAMIQKEVPECEIKLLRNVKDTADLELVRDRKVQDGVDTRTYQVSFKRIKSIFSGFRCDWTVPDGIHEMIRFFREMPLTEAQLNNMDYYRLQKMEYLLKNGYITEDLKWKKRM